MSTSMPLSPTSVLAPLNDKQEDTVQTPVLLFQQQVTSKIQDVKNTTQQILNTVKELQKQQYLLHEQQNMLQEELRNLMQQQEANKVSLVDGEKSQICNDNLWDDQDWKDPKKILWTGQLKFVKKVDNNESIQVLEMPCEIYAANVNEVIPEIKLELWPMKLVTELISKTTLEKVDQSYLKNSKTVYLEPVINCRLDPFLRMMLYDYVGCIFFTSTSDNSVKVIVIKFTTGNQTFKGVIPNDAQGFYDQLMKASWQGGKACEMVESKFTDSLQTFHPTFNPCISYKKSRNISSTAILQNFVNVPQGLVTISDQSSESNTTKYHAKAHLDLNNESFLYDDDQFNAQNNTSNYHQHYDSTSAISFYNPTRYAHFAKLLTSTIVQLMHTIVTPSIEEKVQMNHSRFYHQSSALPSRPNQSVPIVKPQSNMDESSRKISNVSVQQDLPLDVNKESDRLNGLKQQCDEVLHKLMRSCLKVSEDNNKSLSEQLRKEYKSQSVQMPEIPKRTLDSDEFEFL